MSSEVPANAGRASTFSVGSIRCTVLRDGADPSEPEFVFGDAPPEAYRPLLEGRLDADGMLPVPHNPVLVKADLTTLIDAGIGVELAREWKADVGRLGFSLADAGVSPKEVDVVVITHAHPDHVGGLTLPDGRGRRVVYGGAHHVLAEREWRYWVEQHPEGPSAEMAPLARLHLGPVADAGLLELLPDDVELEISRGVSVLPTPGHTPGHISVRIFDQGSVAIVGGDVLIHEWHPEHPDWTIEPDVDKPLSIRSRLRLLKRVAAEEALVQSYHFDRIGRIETTGGEFSWRM